ncbi:unnamed protein product [Mortierella alpina]
MDDLNMDEDFDFAGLSIEEPEERLQSMFERSFTLKCTCSVRHYCNPTRADVGSDARQRTLGKTTFDQRDKSIPSWGNGAETRCYGFGPQPCIQILPNPVPLPVHGPTRIRQCGPTQDDRRQGQGDGKTRREGEKIPEWMLKDPNMESVPTWSQKDASAPGFSSNDFALDWSSSTDLSTAVDSNALFGFSSFPTYETLPISNVIAEEQQRRMNETETGSGTDNTSSTSSSSTTTSEEVLGSGFAKYGSADQASTPMFGERQQGRMVGGDTAHQSSAPGMASSSTPSANISKTSEWQDWRSIPQRNQDIEIDRDYSEEFYALDDDSKNSVKATPGFAPAKFRWEDD